MKGEKMRKRILWMLPVAAAAAGAAVALAEPPSGPSLTPVPAANTKSPGYAPASVLSPELSQVAVAQGATKLENPTAQVSYYGYDNDTVNAAGQPLMVPSSTTSGEAHKTEPDKNAYLVFKEGLTGADPSYDYGSHFLYQGHETGSPGYLTRINLDADAAHRVTLMTTLPSGNTDGITWDPWSKQLILTAEDTSKPTWAATADYPSTLTDLSGSLGMGGYEGVQNDSDGNVWLVEDVSGPSKGGTAAKVPNSFVYRFAPRDPSDLTKGKLEALQVLNASGDPITQASQTTLNAAESVALHTYGNSFRTRWVVVHDTAVDGTAPFNANAAAKAKNATPFKRPENAQFRPGTKFGEFYFDETGDTNATSPENDTAGGWGSIMKLTQAGPSAAGGTLTMFYKANESTTGFDNVTFLSKNLVTFVQDAGDTLHTQANALDSGWVFDVTQDYSQAGVQPTRWLAEGRDPSATLDSANGGFGKNEGDNEITGVHVSDGDPTANGILGAKIPELNNPNWRWFYTQQHGDNFTYEVLLKH
jgi:Alkaline phosphatase PhoX